MEEGYRASLKNISALSVIINQLTAEIERQRQQSHWLSDVLGYHRAFAGAMREIEVAAEDQCDDQTLTKWFASMMGREFSVPDLATSELTFIGGRLFFSNGNLIGQIAYHDREGWLTSFCFTINEGMADQELKTVKDGDLNLIIWTKQGIDYVIVGQAERTTLEAVSSELLQEYGNDISDSGQLRLSQS